MCKIIKIAFKTQVFRKKNWGGGAQLNFFSEGGLTLSHFENPCRKNFLNIYYNSDLIMID